MRALQLVVLALGVLWGGYWVVGSIALQKSVESWFASQAANGRIATASKIEVNGFPSRFDLTVTDLSLADPVSGFGWQAPFAQLLSMTWKPWHLIAALPNSQTITTPREKIGLASSKLQGSLVLVPGVALALDGLIVVGADLVATSSRGWILKSTRAELATRQDTSISNGHEVSLTVTGLIPDPALMAAIAGKSDLPALVETAQIDLVAGFSAPLDRYAAQTTPQVTGITLKVGTLRWGDLVITTKGTIAADTDGFAEGRIDIRVENWRKLLPPAVAMGAIKPEIVQTVENMMTLMAQQSGNTTTLELPLVMKAGRMSLGPVPIGPAPRMIKGAQG